MNDHLRLFTCLQTGLTKQGLARSAPTDDDVPEDELSAAAVAIGIHVHARLGLDAMEITRTIQTAWRAWRATCLASVRNRWYFTGFLNSCTFGPGGELLSITLRNDYYPKWAANMDHPIGPLGCGDEYGGIRALPATLADVPLRSIDLVNNFELDLATLLNLPPGLRCLHLGNLGLGDERRLPAALAERCRQLETVTLSGNPHGWADALACLPASVRVLRVANCGIVELPELAERFPVLEELDLSGNALAPAGLLPHIPSLRCLGFPGTIPSDTAVAFPGLAAARVAHPGSFDIDQLRNLPESVHTLSLPRPTGIFPASCANGRPFGIRNLELPSATLSDAQFLALPPTLEKLTGCQLAGQAIPEGTAERFPRLTWFSAFPQRGFDGASMTRLPASLRTWKAEARGWTEIPDVFSGHLAEVESVDTFRNPIDPASLLRLPKGLRHLVCSGGPNRGETFPGTFGFPRGFKERCPAVESIDAAHHAGIDLQSLVNVAPTLRRLRLAWCGTRPLDLPDGLTDWFPLLEELDLSEVAGGRLPPPLAAKIAAGTVRILSYDG